MDFWSSGIILVWVFIFLLLPTFVGVLLFLFIKEKTTLTNPILSILLQVILLAGTFTLGLYVWATIEAILFETLTWQNVKDIYNLDFAKSFPLVLFEAALIPMFDLWLTRKNDKYEQDNT